MGRKRKNPGPDYLEQDLGFVTSCWIWQHGKSKQGYGMIGINGKRFLMHRVMYEQKYGPVPANLELDHLCRNTLCIRPDHLDPVSHAINVRRGRRAKLSADLVQQAIRRYLSGEPQTSIAREFGVDSSVISEAVRGRTWQGSSTGVVPTRTLAKLTPDDVRRIRERAASGETHTAIAQSLSMDQSHISAIVRKAVWKGVV